MRSKPRTQFARLLVRMGYSEREVLNADARFDWSKLAQAAQGLSLFAEKKIVEVRLPSGKPGVVGAKALETHALNAVDARDDDRLGAATGTARPADALDRARSNVPA